MTADIRTAAQREAEKRHRLNPDHRRARVFFTEGAVWGAARVTPTREQLIERIAGEYVAPSTGEHTEVSVPLAKSIADIVLDLIAGLAEGESSGKQAT